MLSKAYKPLISPWRYAYLRLIPQPVFNSFWCCMFESKKKARNGLSLGMSLIIIDLYYDKDYTMYKGYSQIEVLANTHQKFTAKFLPSTLSGYDCTSCHQKAGMKRTSPGLRTQCTLRALAKFGNLSKSGSWMSTGDITMEVLSRRVFLRNLPVEGEKLRMASGMWAS